MRTSSRATGQGANAVQRPFSQGDFFRAGLGSGVFGFMAKWGFEIAHSPGVEFQRSCSGLRHTLTSSFVAAPLSLKLLVVDGWVWSLVGPAVSEKAWFYALLPLSLLFTALWLLRFRWFWWFSAAKTALSAITQPLEGRSPWLIAATMVSLVLTLWPSTYTYVPRRPLSTWAAKLESRRSSSNPGQQA